MNNNDFPHQTSVASISQSLSCFNYLASAMRMNYFSDLALQKWQQSHQDFNGPPTRRMGEERQMIENWMGERQFLLPHIRRYFGWKIFLGLQRISHRQFFFFNSQRFKYLRKKLNAIFFSNSTRFIFQVSGSK